MVCSLHTAVQTIFLLCSDNGHGHPDLNIGDDPTTLLHGVEGCLQALDKIGESRYKPAAIIANTLRDAIPVTLLYAPNMGMYRG